LKIFRQSFHFPISESIYQRSERQRSGRLTRRDARQTLCRRRYFSGKVLEFEHSFFTSGQNGRFRVKF
jgi:hypothetical protein